MFASSVLSVLNALVHRSVSGDARRNLALFVATRLGAAFAALAITPFFLAYHGAPDLADTLVLASALMPLAGACIAARLGRLDWGRATSTLGLVVLSLVLWFGLGCGFGCAAAWLAAAQIEAVGDRRLKIATATVAAVTLFAMASLPTTGAAHSETADAIFSALALAYAALAALSLPAADLDRGTRASGDKATRSGVPASSGRGSWMESAALAGGFILELDESGTVLDLHGLPGEAPALELRHVIARGFFEHVHVADRPIFLKLIADAAHGAPCAPASVRLRSWASDDLANRRPTHRRLELRALRSRTGTIVALVREAEEAPAIPFDRLSELRHDLRTPLNAIIGFSEILASRTLRPSDLEKQFEYARLVHRSSQTLLDLIDGSLGTSSPTAAAVTPLIARNTPDATPAEPIEYRMKKRA